MTNKERELVLVEWVDSHSNARWRDMDDIERDAEPCPCRSVGWVARKTKDVTVLVSSISGEGSDSVLLCGSNVMTIPNVCIRSTRRMTDWRKEKR